MVVIGIPIYKKHVDEYEKISLHLVNNILVKYAKVFIAPRSLQFDYGDEYHDFGVEYFDDVYFTSTEAYSKLLLSEEFYMRFSKYKFLLIYQLDALVFSDQLEYFCQLNYDYIGAYFPDNGKIRSYLGCVGNGGFSLRKIDATLQLLKNTKELLEIHKFSSHWQKYEDRFFSYCGAKKINGFISAPMDVAIAFSFDTEVHKCYRRNGRKLPFGCHEWFKIDIEFYKKALHEIGYEMDVCNIIDKGGDLDFKNKNVRIKPYIWPRYLRSKQRFFVEVLKEKFGEATYILFGYGMMGKNLYMRLKQEGLKIDCFWDNTVEFKESTDREIKIKKPEFIDKPTQKIIITSNKYENEMIQQLNEMGFYEDIDFVTVSKLKGIVSKKYKEFLITQLASK